MSSKSIAVAALAAFVVLPVFSGVVSGSFPVTYSAPANIVRNSPLGICTNCLVSESGGEPSIVQGQDGTLYVIVAQGAPLPSLVYVSTDNGTSWHRSGTRLGEAGVSAQPPQASLVRGHRNMPIGAEGDLAAAPDENRVYAIEMWVGGTAVSATTDKGVTWTVLNPVAPAPGDRPFVAAGPDGRVVVTVSGPKGIIATSRDGGVTFPFVTTPPDTLSNHLKPVVRPTDGRTFVVTQSGSDIRVSRENLVDDVQFANVLAFPSGWWQSVHLLPMIASDDAGNLYVVAGGMRAGASTVALVTSPNGISWSAPRVLSSGNSVTMPAVAAGASGKAVVAFYEATVAGSPDALPSSARWHVRMVHLTDALSASPTIEEVQLPGDVKAGKVCLSGTGCGGLGSEDRDLWDYLGVTVGADGYARVAYVDAWNDATSTATPSLTHYAAQDGGTRLR